MESVYRSQLLQEWAENWRKGNFTPLLVFMYMYIVLLFLCSVWTEHEVQIHKGTVWRASAGPFFKKKFSVVHKCEELPDRKLRKLCFFEIRDFKSRGVSCLFLVLLSHGSGRNWYFCLFFSKSKYYNRKTRSDVSSGWEVWSFVKGFYQEIKSSGEAMLENYPQKCWLCQHVHFQYI